MKVSSLVDKVSSKRRNEETAKKKNDIKDAPSSAWQESWSQGDERAS
jgi:hypothetical protein